MAILLQITCLIQIIQSKMFKKRGINKPAPNSNSNNNEITQDSNKNETSQKKTTTAINLRKDIQQMQNIISTKKQQSRRNVQQWNENDDGRQEQSVQKAEHSVFKTKKINKFTSHILKNLPANAIPQKKTLFHGGDIKLQYSYRGQQRQEHMKQGQTNLILDQRSNKQLIRPILSNYGLLDKTHFKSHTNPNQKQIQGGQGKDHQQALMDYYIKKKMQQMTKSANTAASQLSSYPSNSIPKQPEAWQQVLQIQKQYLTQQEKIKDYSMEEIHRKIQKLAQQTIKMQLQKRSVYFKDLLQNQHERMQYASKKQLKMMRQQKQRIQKELNSKYRQTGRRHLFESIKNSSL